MNRVFRGAILLAVSLLTVRPDLHVQESAHPVPRFYRFLDWTVPHRVEEAVVQYVYDGDTLQDRYQRRIRLLGVNTPEVAHPEHDRFTNEPGGIQAMLFTEKAVRGKKVLLVVDEQNSKDRFGRTLAVVFLKDAVGQWLCLNWELVREGLADVLILPDNRLCVEPAWYKAAVVARRRRVEDFQVLARSFEEEGRPAGAVETYQQGIRLFPDARVLYESLGNTYLDMNLPGFSVDIFLAYLERRPEDALMRRHLARAYERMAESAAVPLLNPRKKAAEQWSRLLGTEYDQEARRSLERLSE